MSPAPSATGRKSPFQKSIRAATAPFRSRPTSPDTFTLQDSAFRPIPTPTSRSATPTTPMEPISSFPSLKNSSQGAVQDVTYAPKSPKLSGNGNLLQRMNSIAPGPFNFGGKGQKRQSGHRKSGSLSSSRDFIRPISGSSRTHSHQLSGSSSIYTRKYSMSSTSGTNRLTLDSEEVPTIPAMPPPPQRIPQEESRKKDVPTQQNPGFDFGTFGDEKRSHTFPTEENNRSEEQTSFRRRPSEPSVGGHKSKPSVAAAAMQPLYEIGSTSSFKPSRSVRERSRSVGRHEGREDRRIEDAPPVPQPSQAQIFDQKNPYHTPNESTSSNESYSSGVKSGSSRSSPPINESPLRAAGQAFGNGRSDNLFNGFNFDVDKRPSFEEPRAAREPLQQPPPREQYDQAPPPPREQYGHGPLKPRPANLPLDNRLIPSPGPHSPDVISPPPLSPVFAREPERRPSIPTLSPDEYVTPSFSSQLTSQNENHSPRVSPAPVLQPPSPSTSTRRPTTANKGPCRGCSAPIQGKSISSADGRLTGRYHKQCFVCRTCASPFPTLDFYILQNEPYCARHYHALNNSLCTKCDRGIEGQYLETTDSRLKFHPHCFSCQECHRILRDDYFEWNGRTLCEQHAFGAAQRAAREPSSLGPGRRFPERRTTRLMMM